MAWGHLIIEGITYDCAIRLANLNVGYLDSVQVHASDTLFLTQKLQVSFKQLYYIGFISYVGLIGLSPFLSIFRSCMGRAWEQGQASFWAGQADLSICIQVIIFLPLVALLVSQNQSDCMHWVGDRLVLHQCIYYVFLQHLWLSCPNAQWPSICLQSYVRTHMFKAIVHWYMSTIQLKTVGIWQLTPCTET